MGYRIYNCQFPSLPRHVIARAQLCGLQRVAFSANHILTFFMDIIVTKRKRSESQRAVQRTAKYKRRSVPIQTRQSQNSQNHTKTQLPFPLPIKSEETRTNHATRFPRSPFGDAGAVLLHNDTPIHSVRVLVISKCDLTDRFQKQEKKNSSQEKNFFDHISLCERIIILPFNTLMLSGRAAHEGRWANNRGGYLCNL